MLVRRSAYDDIGGFDPAFVEHGADLDFGWRAQLAGHRVIVVPGAVVRDASAGLDGDADPAPPGRASSNAAAAGPPGRSRWPGARRSPPPSSPSGWRCRPSSPP